MTSACSNARLSAGLGAGVWTRRTTASAVTKNFGRTPAGAIQVAELPSSCRKAAKVKLNSECRSRLGFGRRLLPG